MRYFRVLGVAVVAACLILSGTACTTGEKSETTTTEKTATKTGTVKVGDTAPDFEMRNQEQLKVALSEFKDKKNVVLVFYPADFTPV